MAALLAVPATAMAAAPAAAITVAHTVAQPVTQDYPPSPGLILLTNRVAPCGQLLILASGFTPGETVVVTIDSVVIATLTANSSGKVTSWVTIPCDTPPGEYLLTVRGLTSGRVLTAGIIVVGTASQSSSMAASPILARLRPMRQPSPAAAPAQQANPAVSKPVHPVIALLEPVQPAVTAMKPAFDVKTGPVAHQAESNGTGMNGASMGLLGAAGLASLSLGSLIIRRCRRCNAK